MNESTEIREIISFINAFDLADGNDAEYVLNKMTADIDEAFLQKRAKEIISAYALDSRLKEGFRRLSSICSEKGSDCVGCPVNKYCNTYIANARRNIPDDALKMVDLFCGAGGLSLGFTQEGFITSLANDIQECCVDTYAHNHPETPRDHIVLGDIKQVVEGIDEYLRYKDVDIVVGGPPCQGFSEANRQRVIDDPRNHLYKSFVEVVKKVNPPFFVMENVKGMLSVAGQVIEDFQAIGYQVAAHVLNAKDFGVPQNRERLIYIGNRVGIDNEEIFTRISEISKAIPSMTLGDALYGLRPLQASRVKNATNDENEESGRIIEASRNRSMNGYVSMINNGKSYPATCNHKARYNNDRDIEIFGRLNPGDKSDDPKIADIMPYKSRQDIFKDKYFKLEPDKVCKTITAHMKFDCNMYIHPTEARGLTPREAARVQSYPDDYFFRGSYTKTYMQIGNSVPPLLGRAIAKAIKEFVRL